MPQRSGDGGALFAQRHAKALAREADRRVDADRARADDQRALSLFGHHGPRKPLGDGHAIDGPCYFARAQLARYGREDPPELPARIERAQSDRIHNRTPHAKDRADPMNYKPLQPRRNLFTISCRSQSVAMYKT